MIPSGCKIPAKAEIPEGIIMQSSAPHNRMAQSSLLTQLCRSLKGLSNSFGCMPYATHTHTSPSLRSKPANCIENASHLLCKQQPNCIALR